MFKLLILSHPLKSSHCRLFCRDAFSCFVFNVMLFMDEFPATILVGSEWGDAFSCIIFNVMLFMDEFPATILVSSERENAFLCVIFNVMLFMDEFPATILVSSEWENAFLCVIFNVMLFMDEFPATILVGSEWVDAFLIGTPSWKIWRRWTSCQCAAICRRRRFSPKARSTYTDASSSVVRLHNSIVLFVWGGGDMLMYFPSHFPNNEKKGAFARDWCSNVFAALINSCIIACSRHMRARVCRVMVFFPWTSVTYTSGHDYLDAKWASCLMNTHWDIVWSNRQS